MEARVINSVWGEASESKTSAAAGVKRGSLYFARWTLVYSQEGKERQVSLPVEHNTLNTMLLNHAEQGGGGTG